MTHFTRRDFLKTGAISAAAVSGLMAVAQEAADPKIPAVLGGAKAHSTGWAHWPDWRDEDNPAIEAVLKRGVWSRSDLVTQFENQWAEMNGSKHCLAVVNGTNALSASLMELDVQAGDEVICAPYTFSASMLGVLYKGAMPVWADIDPETFQIDPKKIKEKITPRTKAILPVHICGLPSDMTAIMQIAQEYNLLVVEDCCQAHLGTINGKKIGTFGNAGCFSFQTSKVVPIGEGGGIITDDADFKDRLYSYHNYGYATAIKPGTWGAIHSFILSNKIRMAEYQAAIGLCQLKKAEAFHIKRNENGSYLRERLSQFEAVRPVKLCPGVDSVSHYMFPMIFNASCDAVKGMTRDQFVNALAAEGVSASNGYPNDPIYGQGFLETTFASPIYQKIYGDIDFGAYKEQNACPELIKTFGQSIWLSSTHMFLGEKNDMDDIANAVEKILANAERIAQA